MRKAWVSGGPLGPNCFWFLKNVQNETYLKIPGYENRQHFVSTSENPSEMKSECFRLSFNLYTYWCCKVFKFNPLGENGYVCSNIMMLQHHHDYVATSWCYILGSSIMMFQQHHDVVHKYITKTQLHTYMHACIHHLDTCSPRTLPRRVTQYTRYK